MTSTGPRTRGGNRAEKDVAKKKEETKVGKTISFLDENENIGYSFIIQPVKTSFAKFSTAIKEIIGGNSTQPAKTSEQNTKDQTEDQKQAAQRKADVEKQNRVDKALRKPEFTAKLITAESIKSSAYICLPLPTQIPRDQLSVSYSVEDLGAAVAGYTLGSEAADRVANGGSLSELGAAGGSYVIRSLLQEIAPKGVATAFFGNVPNPFAANIFENVDTRTFTFDWVFQPKSVEESRRLREIINQLRYYALPQPNGLLLELPHEFNLAFQGTDFLYAFSRCVLSNIEVSHAPNGFNVFTTADAPQSVALSLTFKEIFPLNKEVIMNFGNPSMTPQQLVVEAETQSPSPSSQTDASKETAVANSQQETENQINQQVADWKTKDTELKKLTEQLIKQQQIGGEQSERIESSIQAKITATRNDMNAIKTEVTALQEKINYKDRTGRTLKPLPSR